MKNQLRGALGSKAALLFLTFLVVFALMSILSPRRFLSLYNLQSMAYQLPEFGILALSMMVVIVTGGINLSVTYTATLSMIVGGVVMSRMFAAGSGAGWAVLGGMGLMLLVSIACGAFNGLIVAYIGVTPMLATLGAMTLFEGISLQITRGGAISGFPPGFVKIGNAALGGIPVPMLIFIMVLIFTYLFLERSRTGLILYMIGSNPTVTRCSGINVRKKLLHAYVIAGAMAGAAGILMASRYNSAKESYGSSYLLQAVSAAVLGGTSIYGGEGKVAGTVIAVMIIQVISSGLNIAGLNRYLTNVVMGVILVLVLAMNYITSRRSRGLKRGIGRGTGRGIEDKEKIRFRESD